VLGKWWWCWFLSQLVFSLPAAKGKGKGIVKGVLKGPELCKDPVKLTSHAVGVNIFKQGDNPALKPHKEYPLQLGPLKNIHELEPDSCEYWKVLRKEHVAL
uniref:Large ribosomal subunit protein mL54 n=2 Tax=Oncorhynchus TaxID=8016 RepID=A0A8C7G774_ONCKI